MARTKRRTRKWVWGAMASAKTASIGRWSDVTTTLYRRMGQEAAQRIRKTALKDFQAGQMEMVLANLFDTDLWTRAFQTLATGTVLDSARIYDWPDLEPMELLEVDRARISDRVNSLITSVKAEALGAVQLSLTQSLGANETIDETTKRLRRSVTGLSQVAGMRIARTETGAHWAGSAVTGMSEVGAQEKEWLAAPSDGRNRETHLAADGQRVLIDENFTVGDAVGPFPCQLSSVAESANCRCDVLPVLEKLR